MVSTFIQTVCPTEYLEVLVFKLPKNAKFRQHALLKLTVILSGSARGGSGIPIYPKKNRQNTPKYPKFLQIYPKIIEALNTLYLKFKESDILNTHI